MKTILATSLMLLVLACQPVFAQNFSIGPIGQTDTVGGMPPMDDILGPGPFPVLPGGTGLNVDAFSYNAVGPLPGQGLAPRFHFSVDHPTTGLAGTAVAMQSAIGPGDHQTDVFTTFGFGSTTNSLLHDGDGSSPGILGPLGLAEGAAGVPGASVDGVNGYDASPTGPPPQVFGGFSIYWSVDLPSVTTPLSPYGGFTEADIFTVGFAGAPILFAPGAALGLAAGDELDALQVYDRGTLGIFDAPDLFLYSLDPFSPSLVTFGVSPGDILLSGAGGFLGTYEFDIGLGLVGGGNVNALSITHVPEPGSIALIALLSCGILTRRRR